MHDDLEIHDFGFIEHAKRLLEEHAVIGNGYGKGGVSSSKVASHPYAYAHSHWKPPSYEFEHKTIRGSFMATTASFLEETGSFEVYWDPLKLSIGFGNWSTRATCGKMESVFGPACFGYLSDTFGRSEYIEEFMRGEQDGVKYKPAGLKGKVYDFIKWYSRIYLELYYRKRSILGRSSWSKLMIPLLRFFSGKLY